MWWRYERFPRSQPREAKGGIKSQSRSGQFGKSWWAKRWIAVLESFNIGARLSRGRSYARRGQVLSIEIDKGKVSAAVQGSMPRPYQVSIQVKELSPEDWQRLATVVGGQALFAAKLLAGEMSADIETAFAEAGLSLFPEKLRDLTTECSCPDYSNPCKHIAAVYYLLGEEFDRDPFLLFKLRGLTREELVGLIGSGAPQKADPAIASQPETPPEPLPTEAAAFWTGGDLPADFFGEVHVPRTSAPVLRRLGGFPFWRGHQPLLTALETRYEEAAHGGLEVFLGRETTAPTECGQG
jgi:uncharacterized Zn finger protein